MEGASESGPWRIDAHVAWVDTEDHVVLVSLAAPYTALPWRLDATGSLVWIGLAQGLGLEELVRLFDAAEDLVRPGITTFARELSVQGLLGAGDPHER